MRHMLAAAILVCSITGTARAQQVPSATPEARLTHGRTVSILGTQGEVRRGRVVEVMPDSVALEKDDRRFTVPFSDVVTIDEIDSLKNGAAAGLLIGAGVFGADILAARASGFELTPAGYVAFGALYTGIGAALGAGVDAMIGGDRRIYERGRTARITVSPALRPDGAGALIRISW